MFEKEKIKIEVAIQKWITEYLLSEDFKTKKGKKIKEVEAIEFKVLNFEEGSDFRNECYIYPVNMYVRAWGLSSLSIPKCDLDLKVNKQLVLKYNEETGEYEIRNQNDVAILDCTPW
ncbi:hypothetical protein [Chryseobacterium sp. WLY505]|uniref:hypothetical protein n=1 Tax=Chryseobacterium sp. WLY505 TaxID=3068892 RepID=UPI002796C884|nr:hypothetical protein [Chryseobacterium sp. WLY505]MDQ1858115.1 hypothetical protein [Chryseobacterium sp. WLY505]